MNYEPLKTVCCAYIGNTNLFTYGADGLRRRSVVNGARTDFAIDGTMAVREMRDINSDGILESIATYFSGMYKRDDANGTLRWYIYDGLGSVLAEVDPSGNVTAGRKYDVYGLVRSGQAGISKHKFVGKLGHPSEDETGLIYMRARYMDPVLGKFVSEDSARDGGNWYAYCDSNPGNYVDTTGHFIDFILSIIIGEDEYEMEARFDVNEGKCLTKKIVQMSEKYNARLEAVFRNTLGGEDYGVSAMVRYVRDGVVFVYHVVWDPFLE